MDTARRYTVLLASFLFRLFLIPSVPVRATIEFTFLGFKGNESEIRIAGEAAVIKPDMLLRLTNRASNLTGTAFYHKPVRLLETNRNSTNATRVRSFSTRFVFVIIPSSSSSGGFGFTFTLSPTPNRPNAGSAQYLGVLNKENNGDPRNHVFSVEFDTVQGSGDDTDKIGNDIGLNFNNRTSDFQEPVVYYQNDDPNNYIPNGSLDSLLYSVPRRSGAVLAWNARFEIAKGIASGLLYLHEEWEQIVVHRDVKPSNVLIESNMNPRLGDFGLARLYERGSLSETTGLVGTIGYMAPELARNGKPSSASDAFAFGVLLLEIVCGRKPTDSGTFYLVDWVMDLHARGEILSAVDPRLGSDYDGREARVALAVGLLCCHQKPAMRGVLRFLNGEEEVVEIDDDWGYSKSSRSDFGSKFVGSVSSSSSIPSSAFDTRTISTSHVTSGGG